MKSIFTAFLCLIFSTITFSQDINRGFAFQSYARNADGSAMSEQTVQVRFTITPNGGSAAFVETQTVQTDPYGVYTADIGTENDEDFEALDFQNFDYFLKVEVALQGGSFVTVSNKQMKAVPYAMSSKTAGSALTAQLANNGVPAGTIISFAGPAANIPDGYVICDGTSYDGNNATYSDLFAAIGTSWGEEGANFRVPDLRGYFLRGFDGSAGVDPGRDSRFSKYAGGNNGNKVGSYQNDEFKGHTHGVVGRTATDGEHSHTDNEHARADNDGDDGPGSYVGGRTAQNSYDFNNDGGGAFIRPGGSAHSHAIDITSQSVGGNETRSKNAYVLYIIKL